MTMKKIHSFEVVPSLPEALSPLKELAYNLRFSWDHETILLFRRLDGDLWEKVGHNPVAMLGRIDQSLLDYAAKDESFLATLDRVYSRFRAHCDQPRWFQKAHPDFAGHCIAYFSAEYGLTECLKIYSGGLGVLSGDHLKSASELGLPLVGVGLLYQQGYFQQYLNQNGWQQEQYPYNDFYNLPLALVRDAAGQPLLISVDFPGEKEEAPPRKVYLRIWKALVGKIPLYLLDTNFNLNAPADQDITDQLYGGDGEIRLQQEIVLGIGGLRALRALGLQPSVCHLNEGHSAFLVLERILQAMKEHQLTFAEARQYTSAGNVFTTHTPVPAGFDVFHLDLMKKYFRSYAKDLGLPFAQFMELGNLGPAEGGKEHQFFSMPTLAINHAPYLNGVSKLHAGVSRKLFAKHWEQFDLEDVPIHSITNGVHTRSWISFEMAGLLDRYLGPRWESEPTNQEVWERVSRIPDEELWRTHERRRERLIAFARRRLRLQCERRGASENEIKQAGEVLHPEVLTICFARRFAGYKRATLLLREREHLKKLLTDPRRPIQIIYAGKAHPRDNEGKELIKQLVNFAQDPEVRNRFVFIENYDMEVARMMVQGCDLWLNTPRRPMEASGTSGMKVLPNGGLNLSVLDGWWAEAYQAGLGWNIGNGEEYSDPALQDAIESNAIYNLLEKEVAPLFYDRGDDRLPRGWIGRMKNSMGQLCPRFNTNRMVHEYVERFYLSALRRGKALAKDNFQTTRELIAWQKKMREQWPQIRVRQSQAETGAAIPVGKELNITALVYLGNIQPREVSLRLILGPLEGDSALRRSERVEMKWLREAENGEHLYQGTILTRESGHFGYTVQIVPFNKDAVLPNELNLITWE